MTPDLTGMIRSIAALLAGGIIGFAFGALQNTALRRHTRLQQQGELKQNPVVMPGSMRRVAWFVVVLVLVQFLCPLLFVDGSQWLVTAGVVIGYGSQLFRKFRQRQAGKQP
jgi:hypothetical protein